MTKIDLAGNWRLSDGASINIDAALPGDNYSALLAAGLIDDPYYGRNETKVQWVRDKSWTFTRSFQVDDAMLDCRSAYLNCDSIDTLAELSLNGVPVGRSCNMFKRFRCEVRQLLRKGENRLAVTIAPPGPAAAAAAAKFPLDLRWISHNSLPHMNFIRKVQCHSGWDWGVSLVVSGLYGAIYIANSDSGRIEHLYTSQRHWPNRCEVQVTAEVVDAPEHAAVRFEFNGEKHEAEVISGRSETSFTVINPKLWYPAGYGEQPLYDLTAQLDGTEIVRRKIGLRQVELVTKPDVAGRSMFLSINQIPVFAKGANWIPCDAMPSRMTPEVYRRLLEDAVAANMNMLRVWGGGQYENDVFYDICDKLGIMLWHDCMFACMEYPANPEFIDNVAGEIEYQFKRLRDHASIMMWCGDNEISRMIQPVNASNLQNILNYDRLNRALAAMAAAADPTRVFWPSSPCNGPHAAINEENDSCGDMHYWQVWHSGKSFDAYYSVKPRFCSEFGFQSFPALTTLESFGGRNPTEPIMDQHQKNPRGNSIILETISRYFRFPESFADFVFLSQVQQTMAMKTGVEFWRSLRPHCMGTLYWQLNDNWPVVSWSSIDYYGNWKLLHYSAKRFYAPTLVTARPTADGAVECVIINDSRSAVSGKFRATQLNFNGGEQRKIEIELTVPPETAFVVESAKFSGTEDNFLHLEFADAWNDYFFAPFKKSELAQAQIQLKKLADNTWELSSDAPAFYVTLEAPGVIWSDNGVTLLPGRPRQLKVARGTLKTAPVIRHLAGTIKYRTAK